MYKNFVKIVTLGVYSPYVFSLSALYIAYLRYRWQTNSKDYGKENILVSSLLIQDNSIMKIETLSLFGKRSYELDMNYVTIERHENDLRKHSYYSIVDKIFKKKFVLIVDEYSQIDEKMLQFLANKKCNKCFYFFRF